MVASGNAMAEAVAEEAEVVLRSVGRLMSRRLKGA